jgi:hypothetical protein
MAAGAVYGLEEALLPSRGLEPDALFGQVGYDQRQNARWHVAVCECGDLGGGRADGIHRADQDQHLPHPNQDQRKGAQRNPRRFAVPLEPLYLEPIVYTL